MNKDLKLLAIKRDIRDNEKILAELGTWPSILSQVKKKWIEKMMENCLIKSYERLQINI